MKTECLIITCFLTILFYSGCSPTARDRYHKAVKEQDADSLARLMETEKDHIYFWEDVCISLGRLRDQRAVPSLVSILSSKDANHSEDAARLLGEFDFGQGPTDPNVIEHLIRSLTARKQVKPSHYTIRISEPITLRPMNEYDFRSISLLLSDYISTTINHPLFENTYSRYESTITIHPGSFIVYERDIERIRSLLALKPGYHEQYNEVWYSYDIQRIAARSLRKITGKDFGDSYSEWIQWWSEERVNNR